ncbi:Uncharacterised protein [Yersinia enterocolitica]|nr:Uncharacterised protein [Yersinia enterocolitica]
MQEVALVAVSFGPGTFQTQIKWPGGVTQSQCLQPGKTVIDVINIFEAAINFVFCAIELIRRPQIITRNRESIRGFRKVLVHVIFGLTECCFQY